MNPSRRFCVLFAILLLAGTHQVSAQVPFDSLRRGDVLRISAEGNRISGRYRGLADSALVLSQEGTTRRLQLTAIDSLWTLESDTRRSRKTGAVIGGGIGVAVFGFFNLTTCEVACTSLNTLIVGAAGVAVGAGLGAVVGSLFGSLAGNWRLLMPPRN
jgi:hypothetical protein